MARSRRVANRSFCMLFKLARAIVRRSYTFGIYRRISPSIALKRNYLAVDLTVSSLCA